MAHPCFEEFVEADLNPVHSIYKLTDLGGQFWDRSETAVRLEF